MTKHNNNELNNNQHNYSQHEDTLRIMTLSITTPIDMLNAKYLLVYEYHYTHAESHFPYCHFC
jgi:hypothetical protein